ncbi:MAG: sulfatase-like hydrolase/transferase, partial [Actinobacteria bacterium]|nr:sulfatase-like hydrolase/transferase [Actinomycetota bacterium]NIS35666.1 sulfatase-like hydrolase/transferase [Actinomycetota bacterium]NIU21883.1 sulfatase-like hydrolase/transferase [Actinomycetota bacterium]NIU70318.1 sulfatase-like hydrolase/transferase [Actinomycetota bacterium]NIV89982.1 sulfatase-like hydrolase/transferase [Actinomycetota bacterium]
SAFPGYNWAWRRSAASVAEVLRLNGYSTAAFGKWHNTPNEESSPVGPFDRWPTSQGFENFYGFVGGETNQWSPTLWEGTAPIAAPDRDGYHL